MNVNKMCSSKKEVQLLIYGLLPRYKQNLSYILFLKSRTINPVGTDLIVLDFYFSYVFATIVYASGILFGVVGTTTKDNLR